MSAPTFGASGTYLSGTTSAPSVPVPSGVAAGSFIIIPMFVDTGGTTVTGLPSGFANAENSPVSNGSSHSLYVFWKRATGNDTGTYDFTFSGSAFSESQAHRYENVKATGTPIDAGTGSAIDDTNGTVTPAVSTSSLGPDRMFLWSGTDWAGGTWTPPSGYTERQDAVVGLVSLAEKTQATAASSGNVSGTSTGSDKRKAWIGALIGTTPDEAPDFSMPVRIPTNLLMQLVEMGRRYTSEAVGVADVTASDSPTGVRLGESAATGAVSITFADSPTGVRLGESSSTAAVGVAGADAPTGLRLGESSSTASIAVVGTDQPTGVRLGESPAVGNSVTLGTDAPTGLRLGESNVSVTIAVTAADTPTGLRLGQSSATAVFDVVTSDKPTGVRMGQSSVATTLGVAVTDLPGSGVRLGQSGLVPTDTFAADLSQEGLRFGQSSIVGVTAQLPLVPTIFVHVARQRYTSHVSTVDIDADVRTTNINVHIP